MSKLLLLIFIMWPFHHANTDTGPTRAYVLEFVETTASALETYRDGSYFEQREDEDIKHIEKEVWYLHQHPTCKDRASRMDTIVEEMVDLHEYDQKLDKELFL